MSDANAAYLAGIIDGEGSIMICSQRDNRRPPGMDRYYYAQVSVTNTYRPLLDWIESVTGRGKTHAGGGRALAVKQVWNWGVRGWSAADVLRSVEPHLIEKKRKAKVALEFAEARHRQYAAITKLSPEALAEYQRIYDKFRAL